MGTERERARFLENAEKSVKKGKFQEAIREYQKVLAVDPRDINVRNLLSDLYLRTNQKDRAIEEMYKIASYYEERGSYSQSMAVYKKINKLNPGNIESTMKLADLYYSQGFLSEAKSEYSKIAKGLMNNNRTREAIFLYEKLLKLDKKDVQTRIALADLYTREGEVDKAVARYNEAAEFKIRSGAFKEAHEILKKAKDLEEDNSRTLSNFVTLLKKENKNKEARKLIDGILKKNKDDVTALRLLGNLHFEEKDFERAEAVFAQVISLRSKDVEARVKLGRIRIFQENLDEAFKLYKPLVETLVKKQKSEKAVGLLGLILSAKKVHTPTLEELASVYKSVGQKKNQEIVCRVLLEEYRKENKQKEYVSTLGELVSLCPEDKELVSQYRQSGGGAEVLEAPVEAELAEEEKLKAEEEVKRAEEERMRAEEVKEKAEEERERTEEGAKRAEEERMRAEAEARRAAEEEAQRTAEEEARKKVEEGAKWAEEGARRAEGEAKRAEEAARKAAGEEARRKVEEEARKKAEEQAQRAEGEMKRAEEHRMRAGEEARKAEEERRRAEDERKRAEEEVKKAVEVRMRLEEQARKAEEEAKRAEEERKRADEERIRAEEEAKRAAEEEAKRAAEEEDRIKAEEEAQKAAEEERRKMEEALEAEKITRVSTEEIKELEDIIEEKKAEEPSEPEGGTDESLEMNLAQAELYINQGLLRNAKRILENLRIQFPNEPRIGETLTSLGKLSSQVSADEILERVSEVSEKESELFDREGDSKDETEEPEDVEEKEEKVEEEVEEPVPEVKEPEPGKIPQEKEDVEAKAEKAEPSKKKEEVKKEVQNDDYMAHFQSGMSFLEKGQTDQAIEKFKLASKEESLKEECFHSLSHCFRQKEEFLEAAKWLKKAQELTEEGTDQFLALSYELASLYEEADEAEKAVALYDEIKKYDPKYRDVKKKTKILKKSLK